MNLTCKICNKKMNCKMITQWKYTASRKIEIGSQRDYGITEYTPIYEVKQFRHHNRRFVFPEHNKGLIFKKRCKGSKIKIVIRHSKRLYTQKELDEIADGHAQFPVGK